MRHGGGSSRADVSYVGDSQTGERQRGVEGCTEGRAVIVNQTSGTVLVPTLISLGCLSLLLFPLGWAFSQTFGLRGIWMSYPATYAVALLLQTAYFFVVWKKKPIRKLV